MFEQYSDAGVIMGLIAGFIFLIVAILIGLYIYMSFAFMAIAKKAKLKTPGIAWIPLVGPTIISYQSSKMHWWPWLLLLGIFLPFIGFLFSIAFGVFSVIWEWKMFEKIKRPGWWAIIGIIPVVNFVIYGIAAWSKK